MSREPDEYAVATKASLAAEQYRTAGIPMHPGDRLSHVLHDVNAKDNSTRVAIHPSQPGDANTNNRYDAGEYVRLLCAAADEVFPRCEEFGPSHTPLV